MWALRLAEWEMEVKGPNVHVKRQQGAGCISWNKRCSTRQHGATSQKTIITRHGTTIIAITPFDAPQYKLTTEKRGAQIV